MRNIHCTIECTIEQIWEHQDKEFAAASDNIKGLWKLVRSKLDNNKGDVCPSIVEGDKIITNPLKLDQLFNNFFVTKIELI